LVLETRHELDADTLMERYAQGDDAAFAMLYDHLAPRLHSYLLRRTGNRAQTEDLLQQTLLQMHCARGRFIPGARVLPWMYAIANRLIIDAFRKSGRETTLPADDDLHHPTSGADDLLHAQQMAGSIDKELRRIPETQRVAFELVKLEGLSLKEAAEALGTTVTSVKLRTHRAYEAIRRVLGDRWQE
jgi:RNA polymerase sigma-70 factor, ECF subfamily